MQALIAAVARLVREMPRNPFVIEVDQALKDELAAKPVAVTSVAVTDCANCARRKSVQRTKMQKYRSKPKARA